MHALTHAETEHYNTLIRADGGYDMNRLQHTLTHVETEHYNTLIRADGGYDTNRLQHTLTHVETEIGLKNLLIKTSYTELQVCNTALLPTNQNIPRPCFQLCDACSS